MNNQEQIPENIQPGDILTRVQLCPFGNFPGKNSMQVCDRAAFEQLIADWQANGSKEILMDFEHQSEVERIDSDTRAAAWISNLAIDDKRGLVGDLKFTDQGAEAVSNRRLRFLSCTWYTDKDGRPAKMTTVALTNKPNIPVAPVLNKEQPDTSTVEEKENPNMDKIKEALGLAPEASEEDVLNAVTALVTKNKEQEQAALEKEAEDFAEQNSKKCNKDVLKAQYIANKEVAKALVAGIPDAPTAEPQQVLNKGTVAAPAAKTDLVKELNKLPAGEARIRFVTEHAAEFADAAK